MDSRLIRTKKMRFRKYLDSCGGGLGLPQINDSPSLECCWIDVDGITEDLFRHDQISVFLIEGTLQETNHSLKTNQI